MKKTKYELAVVLLIFALIVFGFLNLGGTSRAQELSNPDFKTNYYIEIEQDGSALWTIENRISLDTEQDLDDFREFKDEFEDTHKEELEYFSNTVNEMVNSASVQTDRDMTAKDFNLSIYEEVTTIGRFGYVVYEFQWEGFSETNHEEGEIKIGDVFVSGFYLAQEDNFIIKFPSEYSVTSHAPDPDEKGENSISWHGPKEFEEKQPNLIIEYDVDEEISINLLAISLGVIALALLTIGFLYKSKKRGKDEEVEKKSKGIEKTESKIDEKFKSDKEIIIDTIKGEDGAVFQSEIVEKTGFSKSKVSYLLKSLAEEDKIKKIQKGRENIIKLI